MFFSGAPQRGAPFGLLEGIAVTLASKFHELRVRNKKSLQDVADAVQASKTHLWDIERGQSKNPSLDLLKRIADFFKVSISELVDESPTATGEPEELIALYRGLKDLSAEDRETIGLLMERLKKKKE